MPSAQQLIHSMEQGGLGRILRRILLCIAVAAIALLYLFFHFQGLSKAEGMDQAQVAREIARGNGFTTKLIRPLALRQFVEKKGRVPKGPLPDTFNAPLHPLINAIPLKLVKARWGVAPAAERGYVFAQDRAVAGFSILLFCAALVVFHRLACRLFDARLALIGVGLLVVCDLLWQFSLSGLPHMLLLLLFGGALYACARAIEAQTGAAGWPAFSWLALAGVLLGLLTLAHGLAFWIFLGIAFFAALNFRPRGVAALWMAGPYIAVVLPWLLRNFAICGDPLGVSLVSCLGGIKGSVDFHMRSFGEPPDLSEVNIMFFRDKIEHGIQSQVGALIELLGWSVVALCFFLSLLHSFKRPETGAFRWLILCGWLGALFGMALWGLVDREGPVQMNQLHVLFIPPMTFYGLAFVLVLWRRLAFGIRFFDVAFVVLLFLICGYPFYLSVATDTFRAMRGITGGAHWPPYYPPLINRMGGGAKEAWTKPHELLASDMPWAVAWYADRKCLWIPKNQKDLFRINDEGLCGGPICLTLFSPITADLPYLSQMVRGEWEGFTPLVLRLGVPKEFPLQRALPLPVGGSKGIDFLVLSDFMRWDPNAVEHAVARAREQTEPKSRKTAGEDTATPAQPSAPRGTSDPRNAPAP